MEAIHAPTVLGWRRWRDIEEQYGLGMLKTVLQQAAEAGRVPARLVEPFAHILLATGNEMALVIALADDVPAAQAAAEAAVEEFLTRLLRPTGPENTCPWTSTRTATPSGRQRQRGAQRRGWSKRCAGWGSSGDPMIATAGALAGSDRGQGTSRTCEPPYA